MRLHIFLTILALAGASFLVGCSSNSPTPTTTTPTVASASPEPSVERVLQTLPDSGFKAQITPVNPPAKLPPGQRADVTVRVKNTSDATWPMRGRAGDGVYQVNLGDRWIDAAGGDVKVDERAFLPRAVKPGEEIEIPFTIVAPNKTGDFTVEIDMVQEGVAWFVQKGSQPARIKIKVE